MWIITSIILGCIALLSLISGSIKSDKIRSLKYQLDYKRSRPQKLMVDTDNKVVIFQFMTGRLSEDALKQFEDSSKTLIDKDYLVLAVDDTFDVTNINFNNVDKDKAMQEWKRFKG
ncbi:hypothetical protein [Staphylococcus caeli]|uniref:hypothetical protein n=1 Tax=Staphylococcus caeli TaxID=2201815 RepID=UPI003F578C91